MDKLFHHDLVPAGDWTLSGVILIAWIGLGWVTARFVFSLLKRRNSGPSFYLKNTLARAIPVPIYALVTVTGFIVSVHYAPFLDADAERLFRVLKIILCIALIYLADSVLQALVRELEARHQDLKNSHLLFAALIHIVVWVVGLMVILESLGVSITPLLASLGVGSLAVALALQSTLANLFSGFYLLLDKPVRSGDFVKLPSGEQGFIEVIGWRTTRIRTLENNILVIPNSKLAENQILNFHLPDSICSVLVDAGVDYDSDLEKVERVTNEVARQVQEKVEGANPGFKPFLHYNRFDDSAIHFTVTLSSKTVAANDFLKHEFIKALHQRYRTEGIVMPFPVQTLEFRDRALADRLVPKPPAP
jgi:small-conductance mechanosensitive channel